MRKVALFAILTTWAFFLGSASANAQSGIGLLPSSSQNVTFTATSTTSMTIALGMCSGGTCTLSGSAAAAGDAGTYTFMTTGTITAGPQIDSTGQFSVNGATTSFKYTGGDGDMLAGTIVWTTVSDGSPQTRLNGILTIGSISGDSAFLALFPGGNGSTASIDMTTNPLTCSGGVSSCTLEGIFASMNGSGSATISSGEVVVPEPGSLALLGSGLVGIGIFLRRRLFA